VKLTWDEEERGMTSGFGKNPRHHNAANKFGQRVFKATVSTSIFPKGFFFFFIRLASLSLFLFPFLFFSLFDFRREELLTSVLLQYYFKTTTNYYFYYCFLSIPSQS